MGSKTWGPNTLNNYTDDDIQLMKYWASDVTRLRVAKEIGESGTPHLQFSVTFKKFKTLAFLKKLHTRVHWEKSRVEDSVFLYDAKEGSEVIIDIDNRHQGHRSDLDAVIRDIRAGATVRGLWETHTATMVRYHRGLTMARNALNPTIDRPSLSLSDWPYWQAIEEWNTAWVIWGEPGIGKTEWALAHFESPLLVRTMDQLQEFLPDVHDGLIFDDMSFSHIPVGVQIALLDSTRRSRVKTRYVDIEIPAHTKKIFTTNVFNGMIFTMEQGVPRRVKIRHLTGPVKI